ncbi:MAG: phosphoribosyltransferase family protein [Candidatus Dependentiae bacterium]|nr:phosphoribosyltransferase family protein [Candidatus Dependentiae bacterium]
MKFKDRVDAGQQLAEQLSRYKNIDDVVVLGLSRGGVVTAHAVAEALHLPLDVMVVKKIGSPSNDDLAVGALTAGGTTYFNKSVMEKYGITVENLVPIIEKAQEEVARRLKVYRDALPARNYMNKTVIVIDDGMVTGSTMQAAILSLKNLGAKKVVIAVPVSSAHALRELKAGVDEVLCLYESDTVLGVSQFYDSCESVTDDEVVALLGND